MSVISNAIREMKKSQTDSNLARVSERQLRTMLTTWVTVGRPVEQLEYLDNREILYNYLLRG